MTAVSQFDINSNIIRINMIYSLDSRVSKSDEYNIMNPMDNPMSNGL